MFTLYPQASYSYQVRSQLPNLKYIIQWSGTEPTQEQEEEGIFSWDGFLRVGKPVKPQLVEGIITKQKPEQCCSLLYTSGIIHTQNIPH